MSASEITDVVEIIRIPVIRVTNPFDPREFVNDSILWKAESTLLDYFPAPHVSVVVSINGKIIPQEEYSTTYLDRTDNLVVCPVPTGGDSGKSILRMVAMIALTYFTAGMGASAAGAMGLTGTTATIAGGMIQAGIIMAGSMLINSVFAPPQATQTADITTSSSYGIDGAKNTSIEGIPVPVCYGEFRMAGNILGLYVENDTEDAQILYMLISAGEGPVSALSDVMINDNPLEDYLDVEVQTRLGLDTQTPIPWFEDTTVAINKSQKMTTDWFYSTTTTRVDKIRIDFVAPNGLFSADTTTGALNSFTVALNIEYRVADSLDGWLLFPTESVIGSWTNVIQRDVLDVSGNPTGAYTWVLEEGSSFFMGTETLGAQVTDPDALTYLATAATWTETDGGGGGGNGDSDGYMVTLVKSQFPSYIQTTDMTAAKRSAVRKSFSTPKLTVSKYEVRVSRAVAHSDSSTVSDEIYLSDINEIVLDDLSYPNTALLALKIRMTDQLSGLPKVTYINGGRNIMVYGRQFSTDAADSIYFAPSKNPAWVVWDILTNVRFGGQMSTSRIDWVSFKEWADFCDKYELTWNGVIDTEMNVWDACQLVLRIGHAQIINIGTRYSIIIEREDIPVMMFSVANITEGSYKETWLGTADRANEIDVTFFDKTDDYRQRTLKLYDPAALVSGEKQRSSAITLYGVTDFSTAMLEAKFQLNLNRYILKTVNFSAPMEAVACSVGDLIYVQHDMTEWAVAGRFAAGCTSSVLNLDRPVEMSPGKQYKMLITHDAVNRGSGIVQSAVGISIILGWSQPLPIKRISVGGRDLRIAGTFGEGTTFGIILDDYVEGVVTGSAYTLWDTDVVEEYNVVNLGATSSVVTLQSPASFVPVEYGNWMLGESEKVKNIFRIKSVSGTHDYNRDITAIEYRPEVYDYTRFGDPNAGTADPGVGGVIGVVRSLQLYEDTYISGESIKSEVIASWQQPLVGLYAGADICVKVNDGEMAKYFEVKNKLSATINAVRGDVVTVRVVAFDLFGLRAPYELSPQVTYTVIGETGLNVSPITGAQFIWSGRDCKISWRYNSLTHSYEFGSEPNGGDSGAPDPQFKDFEVRVYDATGLILRRTEHVTDNFYTYTYDKNFTDGITRHLVFEIRARDILNNLGDPATLDAYNPPPTVQSTKVTTTFESAVLSYTHSNDSDFSGALVWVSRNAADLSDFATISPFQVFNGPDASINLPGLMFDATYYYRIAAYDLFGITELIPTDTLSFKTTFLDVNAIAADILKDSVLIPELRERINLIDAAAGIPGSVNTRIDTVKDIINDSETGLPAAMSMITALNDVSSTSESAAARTVAGLSAAMNNPSTGLAATNAAIVALNDVSSTSTSALAQQINQLTTTVGGYTTSIETATQSIDGLNAQYTVKIDSYGHVSGFGLASTSRNGVPSSEFIVNADVFGVVMPGYPDVYPFTIGVVSGVPRVVISNALIGDASISQAKIGSLSVNTLDIAGNAVTVPASGTSSCSLYMSYAGSVYVTCNIWVLETGPGTEGGTANSAYSLQINSSSSGSGGFCIQHTPGARHATSATSCRFNVSAGWHTFSIALAQLNGSYTSQGFSIMAIGTMR